MSISHTRTISPLKSYQEEFLPESDGKPMAESDVHRELMLALLHALKQYFREDPQVYVSGNIFIYYLDENRERQCVAPDIFVVFGVEKKDRRIYKLEEEGRAPQVVIELTSTSTKVEDMVKKHYIYANLGVREYFLFDPYSETMRPGLRGFRLERGEYVQLAGLPLRSEVLGLELRTDEGRLRLFDTKTGTHLRTPDEAELERRAEESARLAAEERAARAETELARLREEVAKLQRRQK